MQTIKCKSCGADMLYVTTENGRQMPLDPVPCDDGNVWIGDDGVARVMGKGDEGTVSMPLYKSHFATCVAAKTHRKKA